VTDVKWLLNGHAHPDHAGGLSQLKHDTGALFAAMRAEVVPLEHNGRGAFYHGDKNLFDSISVDRVLDDGEHIDLGGIRLTAHLTAGHTPGCTTWTMLLLDGRKQYRVVIACQISVPSAEISYPGMDADFGADLHFIAFPAVRYFSGRARQSFFADGKTSAEGGEFVCESVH